MIDKVIIRVIDEQLINNIIIPKLTANANFRVMTQSSSSYFGHFKNFRIDKKGNQLRLSGSLAKYELSDNCFNGNFETLSRAVNNLCNETGIARDSIVTYLEFGHNIPVSSNPYKYLRLLKYASGYNTQIFYANREVVFLQDERKMRFYDKTQDFRRNQQQIRLDENLKIYMLRYEIALLYPKRVLKSADALTLDSLCSNKIYKQLLNMWVDEFKRVKTDVTLRYDFPFKSIADIKKHLTLKGMESYGGLTGTLSLANSVEFVDCVSQNRLRLKNYLEQTSIDGSFVRKIDLFEELESKIKLTAAVSYSF